jgi:F-type H+-transporting ATPase subunit b
MIDLNISALIQIINFFIVLAVLNAILYRPIRAVIRKRAQRMEAQLHDIENFSAQAEQKMASYTSALSVAQQKGAEIRAQLKDEGYQEETALLEDVNKQAARELKNAREDAASQIRSTLDSLKAKVDGYAQKVTEKVVGWAI